MFVTRAGVASIGLDLIIELQEEVKSFHLLLHLKIYKIQILGETITMWVMMMVMLIKMRVFF